MNAFSVWRPVQHGTLPCKGPLQLTPCTMCYPLTLWAQIIVLKRFYYHKTEYNKIETLVRFPLRGLDLSRWIEGPVREHCPAWLCGLSRSEAAQSPKPVMLCTAHTPGSRGLGARGCGGLLPRCCLLPPIYGI